MIKKLKIFLGYTLCVTSVTLLIMYALIQAVLQTSYRMHAVTAEEIAEVSR